MYNVYVALGENANVAEEQDPEAINLELENPDDESKIWKVFEFDTEEESQAFRLGLAEAYGYLDAYWIEDKTEE